MFIYQGIQLVFAHVVSLINSVTTWWSEIQWAELVDVYPISFQPLISSFIVIILSMAIIGFVKKMSFLLG